MDDSRAVLLRVAALSIEESAQLVDQSTLDDPYAMLAIRVAAGSEVLGSAANKPRATETVVRYLARMGGRATPYGLFAGTAPASISDGRALQLGEQSRHRIRSRVDIAALEAVIEAALESLPITRWPLRTNPLARIDGPLVRFAKAGDASADVVTIAFTTVIAKVLDLLGGDVRTGAEVIDELCAWHPEVSFEDFVPHLTGLVEAGLVERFTGLLEPGVEPADRAVRLLRELGALDQADALGALIDDACGLHPLSPSLDVVWDHPWQQAGKVIQTLTDVAEAKRFDHQLELGMEQSQLDRRTVDDLVGALLRLQQLNGSGPYDLEGLDPQGWVPETGLGQLRERFRARYEDAEVPLLAAVDLESGILQPRGRQVSRLAAAAGITSDGRESDPKVSAGVLKAYRRSTWQGGVIDIADFPASKQLTGRALLAVLLDDYEGRYDSMLIGALGRSPFALMARFGLNRPEMMAQIDGQIAAERQAQPATDDDIEPIRAELMYAPGGRIGNVLVRPKIMPHSIALGQGGGGTLSLDRLLLRLDGDTFQLRDRDSGRPVVVELNTAHNIDFAGLDPVYSVLGKLAGGGGTSWTWSGLDRLDHLPRVTCGRVIVAPEQWRLAADQILRVRESTDPGAELRKSLSLGDQRRWLGAGALDQILPLDLSSATSIRTALARHRGNDGVRLIELPQAEAPATTGPRGHHVTEAVIGIGTALRTARRPPRTDITFCPLVGARWVYVRYYCGQSSAEQVVVRASRLAAELSGSAAVTDWFFVRYDADGPHIRVRMLAAPAHRDDVLAAVSTLGAQLRAEGLIGRIVIDDYVPEIGRYGGTELLGLAERVFTASSTAVAALLATGPTETSRIFRAVADVMACTEAVHETTEDQIAFLQGCQSGLEVRFSHTGNSHGKLLREHRAALDAELATYRPDPDLLSAVGNLAEAVRSSPTAHRLLPILGSTLHMHCNRLFAFDAVRLEFLTHEWSIRKLRERAARRTPVSA